MNEPIGRPGWTILERQQKINLRYALSNPSGSEILEGTTLNTLLDGLKDLQSKGKSGTDVPLDSELLKRINVTAGGGVNPALLKSEKKLDWPLALQGTSFSNLKTQIENNLASAIADASRDAKDPGKLANLETAIKEMSKMLDAQDESGQLTPSQSIEANKYIVLLQSTLRALSGPNARDYVEGKFDPKSKTVGDLVKKMSGLSFAPASPGDEQAYRALQEKLKAYYNSIAQGPSSSSPMP